MLINFTNHPSDRWSPKQLEAALRLFGEVKDLPFPEVDPAGDELYIKQLAEQYIRCIFELIDGDPKKAAVHIQGEFTLVYRIVSELREYGVKCVASTTRRIVVENDDGTRTYRFEFVRFREYI